MNGWMQGFVGLITEVYSDGVLSLLFIYSVGILSRFY